MGLSSRYRCSYASPTPSGSAIPITGMALTAYKSFLLDYLHADLISAPSLRFLRLLFGELISFPTKCDRRRGVPRGWLSSPLMLIEELDHVLADVTPSFNYLLCVRLCYTRKQLSNPPISAGT
jgi:hypothetical protein